MARVKTDAERGQPGAWLYHARNSFGLSHDQVATALSVDESGITKAEGKAAPEGPGSRVLQDRLIGYYRKLARERPDVALPELPEAPAAPASPDQAELVAAIRDQTAAITKLAAAMEAENRERRRETATTRAWLRGWRAVLRAAAQGQVPGDLLDALVPPQPGDGHP